MIKIYKEAYPSPSLRYCRICKDWTEHYQDENIFECKTCGSSYQWSKSTRWGIQQGFSGEIRADAFDERIRRKKDFQKGKGNGQ